MAERATHVVQAGETLVAIGELYGVSWRDLAVDNELDNRDHIEPGQVIKLPYHEYTVVEGDTLTEIVEEHGVHRIWRDVARYNQIDNPDLIHPNQVIKLPIR